MNRKQLPRELKLAICKQVAAGEWSVGEAVELSTFGAKTLHRWLGEYAQRGEEAFSKAPREREKAKGLSDPAQRLLEQALERSPQMRTRALVGYIRRHHGVRLPRRAVAAYLKERGLTQAPVERAERPLRRFEAPAPLDLLQVDILHVRRRSGGWFYVVNVLDDHSRMLLGSTALEEQSGPNVLSAFRQVVAEWGRPNRVLTDRGTQFAHWRGRTAFNRYVEEELMAEHILAATQHPQTMGKVERFHRTQREEGLDPKGYAVREDLQGALDRFRLYYNYERTHEALSWAVPADRFYAMAQPLSEVWRQLSGWGPQESVFLTMNMMGRRVVLAGPRMDQLQVVWDDQLRRARPARES